MSLTQSSKTASQSAGGLPKIHAQYENGFFVVQLAELEKFRRAATLRVRAEVKGVSLTAKVTDFYEHAERRENILFGKMLALAGEYYTIEKAGR